MNNHPDSPRIADALRWLSDSGIEVQQWAARERANTLTVLARTTRLVLIQLEFRLDGGVYSDFPPVINGLPAQSGEYAQRLGDWRKNHD